MTPSISIIIGNRNEAQYLRHVLKAIKMQEYPDYEVILVDNCSTDESAELARQAGAKIVTIERFTYGSALNLGINAARGEIIVILSAHAVPLGPHFLTECAKPFNDPLIAAVRCVYAGKSSDRRLWLDPQVIKGDVDYWDLSAVAPLASGCAIRRSVWEQIPFDEKALAAEEKLWCVHALEKGFQIYSAAPAFYDYIKKYPLKIRLRRQQEQILAACYTIGGGREPVLSVLGKGCVETLRAAFISAPVAAFRALARPLLVTYFKLFLAFQMKRPD
jgi:glycosyltransferase involved in cell wall biosynthesis